MAFGKTFVLCSPFSGTALTHDGKPAAGIRLERKWVWAWNDKTGNDQTVTDEQGRFNFPLVTGTSFAGSFLPHEPNVLQEIKAFTPDGPVEIWSAYKKNYGLNSEMQGRPIRVKCYIDKPPSDEGLYWGTCVEDEDPQASAE